MNKSRLIAAVALAVLLAVSLLPTGCVFRLPPGEETDGRKLPESAGPNGTEPEIPSGEVGTGENVSTGEPRKEMKDTAYLSCQALGLTAFEVTSDHEGIADAIPGRTSPEIVVRAYADGEATLTAADYWGHTAVAQVTVESGKIRAVTVKRAFSDPKVVNVRLAGAVGDGVADDTDAIQNAIDSLPEGGEVLLPAGVYSIRRLILGEGIDLRLQGKAENPTAGYTAELAARVAGGREFAVLKSQLRANNLILNHDPGTN